MDITVSDCLTLPALRQAKVVAGANGLGNKVLSVTVMEATDLSNIKYLEQYSRNNELVISSLYAIRSDVEKQCKLIRQLHHYRSVGMIIFLMREAPLDLSQKFLDLADELQFPIAYMPTEANVTFSDAIHAISNLIYQSKNEMTDLLPSVLLEYQLDHREDLEIQRLLSVIAEHYNHAIYMIDKLLCVVYSAEPSQIRQSDLGPRIGKPICDYCVDMCRENFNYVFSRPRYWELPATEYVIHSIPIRDITGRSYAIFFVASQHAEYFQMRQIAGLLEVYINKNVSDDQPKPSTAYANSLLSAAINRNESYANYLASQLRVNISSTSSIWMLPKLISGTGNKKYAETWMDRCCVALGEELHPLLSGTYGTTGIILFRHMMTEGELIQKAEKIAQLMALEKQDGAMFIYFNPSGIHSIADMYWTVHQISDTSQMIFPRRKIFFAPQMQFSNYCHYLKGILTYDHANVFPLLNRLVEEPELIEVLETLFLDTSMNIKQCAEMLFIHKNTVYYRLKKIENLLGYDPFSPPVSNNLMLEAALHRIYQKDLSTQESK